MFGTCSMTPSSDRSARPSSPPTLAPACVLHVTPEPAIAIPVVWPVSVSIALTSVQVIQQPQPLAEAAAALAELSASGHARLAAQHLMDLLKEALYAVHLPRFWARLAPLAADDIAGNLLEMLPAAVQVGAVSVKSDLGRHKGALHGPMFWVPQALVTHNHNLTTHSMTMLDASLFARHS